MAYQIMIEKLEKKFAKGFHLGINQINFLSPTTSCLLGPNGAGKSTFFQLLTGNILPDAGSIFYNKDLMSYNNNILKRKIGYLPQEPHLPKWITAIELLSYMSKLHGIKEWTNKVEELLLYWDCKGFAKKPLNSCSHGMQKRIGLAIAGLHEPDYLMLDEPFAGLDLFHTHRLEEYINRRHKSGKITIISTHIIPYAANLCDTAFVFKDGKIFSVKEWCSWSYDGRVAFVKETFLGS